MNKGNRIINNALAVIILLFLTISGCSQDKTSEPKAGTKVPMKAAGPSEAPAQKPATQSSAVSAPSSEKSSGSLYNNQLPGIMEVSIEPSSPVSGDELKALAKTVNVQAGQPVIVYRWTVNGVGVQESKSDTLEQSIKKGDYVEVAAKLDDPSAREAAPTCNVRVGNAPPELRLVSQSLNQEGLYEAHLEAVDPEESPVTYSLKKGPEGMSVDCAAGVIRWSAGASAKGVSDVEVSAQDSEGAETILSYQINIRQESMKGVQKSEASKP